MQPQMIPLLLAALATLSIPMNGLLLAEVLVRKRVRGWLEGIVISLLLGSALLIFLAIIFGAFGLLSELYWSFLLMAPVALVLLIMRGGRSSKAMELPLPKGLFSLMVLIASTTLFLKFLETFFAHPGFDAVEMVLASARMFYESGFVPSRSSVYLPSGDLVATPPGVSIIFAYIFTIAGSSDPSVLAFTDVVYLFTLCAMAYVLCNRAFGSVTGACMSFILSLANPFWSVYFTSMKGYADLPASFITSGAIVLFSMVTASGFDGRGLLAVWLSLFAAATSKLNGVIAIGVVAVILLRGSNLGRRWNKVLAVLLTIALAAFLSLVGTGFYTPTRIVSDTPTSIFTALLSLLSLLIVFAIFTSDRYAVEARHTRISKLNWLAVLAAPAWYLRNWYLAGSPFVPLVKLGDAAWAGQFLADSIRALNIPSFLDRVTVFVTSSYFFYLIFMIFISILAVIGWKKTLHSNVYTVVLEVWVLTGLVSFLALAHAEDPRYLLYFLTPVFSLAGRGLFKVSSAFKRTLTFRRINIDAIAVLSIFLLVLAGSRPFFSPQPKTMYMLTADAIRHEAKASDVVLSFGLIGAYYYTGYNTLNIIYPETLAVIRPFLQGNPIDGINYLVNKLGIRMIVIPAEENAFWYTWYQNLQWRLPNLRLLYNPSFTELVHFNKYGWYILRVRDTKTDLPPIGILDLVVKGSNVGQAASLLIPADYGQEHVSVANTRERLQLVSLIYMPATHKDRKVTFEIRSRVNITIVENFGDWDHWYDSVLETSHRIEPSGTIQVILGNLYGNESTMYTAFSIKSVEIEVLEGGSLISKSVLVPRNDKGTWLTYFPDRALWTHLGTNMIYAGERR